MCSHSRANKLYRLFLLTIVLLRLIALRRARACRRSIDSGISLTGWVPKGFTIQITLSVQSKGSETGPGSVVKAVHGSTQDVLGDDNGEGSLIET